MSKMSSTAGARVGVMGDPAGPRGNRQGFFFFFFFPPCRLSRTSQVCAAAAMSQLLFLLLFFFHSDERTIENQHAGVELPACSSAPHLVVSKFTHSNKNKKNQAASSFSFFFSSHSPLPSFVCGARLAILMKYLSSNVVSERNCKHHLSLR